MSDKALLQLQTAKETTWGTPVTPYTAKHMLIDDVTFTPVKDTKRLQEMRGSLAPAYVAVLLKDAVEGTIKGVASYEDGPYAMDALMGTAAPSGTSPYIRNYLGPLTAVVASPRIQTMAFGNSVDGAYQAAGVVYTQVHYSVKNADVLNWDCKWIGKAFSKNATLTALSDRTVTPITAGDMTVYFDDWGNNVGTTSYAGNIYSVDLMIDAKRDLRYYLGSLQPGRYREPVQWDFTLKLTAEFVNASPNTQAWLNSLADLTAGSVFEKLVRLRAVNGSQILQYDLAGVCEKVPNVWTYDNNIQTLELELKGLYSSTSMANYLVGFSQNSVSALA